jgi:transposase-like protein
MGRIFYATCPHCRAYSVVEDTELDLERLTCIECNREFAFEKDLLKTLDEIVEEGEDLPKASSG